MMLVNRFGIICLSCSLLVSCQRSASVQGASFKFAVLAKSIFPVNDSAYPEIVRQWQIQAAFDQAKFNLYLTDISDTPRMYLDRDYAFTPPKPMSAYPLILDTVLGTNDSPVFVFSYYINGALISEKEAWKHKINVTEAVYLRPGPKKKTICFQTRGYSESCLDINYTCIEPNTSADLQKKRLSQEAIDSIFSIKYFNIGYLDNPGTISFIRANYNSLNSWFVDMARQRGYVN